MFSKVKRIIAPILSLAILLSILTPALAASGEHTRADFTDVPPTHWAYDAVMYCADKGFMNGKGNNEFKPDDLISEAEVYATLVRILLTEEQRRTWTEEFKNYKYFVGHWVEYNSAYEKSDWAYIYLMLAGRAGLAGAYTNYVLERESGVMPGRDPMTRNKLASSLVSALKFLGEYNPDGFEPLKVLNCITDGSDILRRPFSIFVAGVLAHGLMNGDSNGRFNYDGFLTRAAACEVFMRLDNSAEREKVKAALNIPSIRGPITIDMRAPEVEHEPPIVGDTVIRPDGTSVVLARDSDTGILGLHQNVGPWIGVRYLGDGLMTGGGLIGTGDTWSAGGNYWTDFLTGGWYIKSNLETVFGEDWSNVYLFQQEWGELQRITSPNRTQTPGKDGQIDSTGLWRYVYMDEVNQFWTWLGPDRVQ